MSPLGDKICENGRAHRAHVLLLQEGPCKVLPAQDDGLLAGRLPKRGRRAQCHLLPARKVQAVAVWQARPQSLRTEAQGEWADWGGDGGCAATNSNVGAAASAATADATADAAAAAANADAAAAAAHQGLEVHRSRADATYRYKMV